MSITAACGSLTITGCGLHPGHMTLETESIIREADLVLVVAPNPLANRHIQSLNAVVENLGHVYTRDLNRLQIYQAMADRIVECVRAGKNVCAVFYGHPGIFVLSTHLARKTLLADGYPVRMLPGISADACLFAELDLDPATTGCQSYEASQFLLTTRQFDTGAALILWQIGLVGEHTLKNYCPAERGLEALTRLLRQHYPSDHQVCLYEAAVMPGFEARIEWLDLRELPQAATQPWTTLYVPAGSELVFAEDRVAWLGLSETAFVYDDPGA